MRGEEGVVSLQRRALPLSPLPTGFAKKTFISYSVTFGDSFRQGKVVAIDPGRQQVVLSDGEVGVAMTWLLMGSPASAGSQPSAGCVPSS